MSTDEKISTKQEWYDLKKYKDEIQGFVKNKRVSMDVLSQMERNYNILYRTVYFGTDESDVERFPYAAEQFKVYKSALIEACLQGYSALVEVTGNDAYSTLKAPEVKKVMTQQFKGMSLLENLSGDTLDDWCFKGEAISFIKLKEKKEEFRRKVTLTDQETNEPIMEFKMIEGVSTKDLAIERIDPLDFFVDGFDYRKDPIGCTKIIRSYIDAKTLLSSDAYPLLSMEDKKAIVEKAGRNGQSGTYYFNWSFGTERNGASKSDKDQIEVLTFHGDYITSDGKVLNNICAVLVGNCIANLRYNDVSTCRIIYAPYKLDRRTHRGVSPLMVTTPINKLTNRVCDMFLKNLEDISNPWLLYQKGSILPAQMNDMRRKKEVEYNPSDNPPTFFAPPPAAMQGLQLVQLIIEQGKNVLGLNKYMAGDSSGSVRTAQESSILFQKANARMRVETDVFSYNFMLNLFNSFYSFNRELALAYETPLDPIYADPELRINISTNASRADREGELQRLMSMLNLPIAQMIFSNLQPDQIILATRYLMAKADLVDADNLLELIDQNGNATTYVSPEQEAQIMEQQALPPEMINNEETINQEGEM